MTEARAERFQPTSGRLVGVVGLVLVAVVLVSGVLGGFPVWVLGAVVLVGLLVWASLLRPGVRIEDDALVLRGMFSTTALPLAAVEEVVVSQVLAVRVGERRYVSPAVGHPLRRVVRGTQLGGVGGGAPGIDGGGDGGRQLVDLAQHAYPSYVQERIRAAAEDHRKRVGVAQYSEEQRALAAQVTRTPAYVEIAAVVVCGLVVGVGLALG